MAVSRKQLQQLLQLLLLLLLLDTVSISSGVSPGSTSDAVGEEQAIEVSKKGVAGNDTKAAATAAAAAAAGVGERHLRMPSPFAAGVPMPPLLIERGAPHHLDVPEWGQGVGDIQKKEEEAAAAAAAASPAPAPAPAAAPVPAEEGQQQEEQQQKQQKKQEEDKVKVEFGAPFPPETAWAPASFSGYGANQPMGALVLACTLRSNGSAICDVLSNKTIPQAEGITVHMAWSMWGDKSTGEAFVSLVGGAPLGPPSSGVKEAPLECCEASSNAEGCIGCTGLPSGSYDPLNMEGGGSRKESGEDEDKEDDDSVASEESGEAPEDDSSPPASWYNAEEFKPVTPQELFSLLPNLQEQVGADANPENLPCSASGTSPAPGLPTLGDVLRSRSDLTLFESMLKTSHIQQLIPCPLTFFAVADDRARDFQGRRAPACLSASLSRPENQRKILQLAARMAILGKVEALPVGARVPVLYGAPGRTGRRGRFNTWDNVELTNEKIVFDKGVIHMLSRSDLQDPQGRELLRQIVYWDCLHDHLVQNPGLTRIALIMVDNRRSLPIIGVPPSPRPAWVARANPGWFAPPAAKQNTQPMPDAKEEKSEDEAADKDGDKEDEEDEEDETDSKYVVYSVSKEEEGEDKREGVPVEEEKSASPSAAASKPETAETPSAASEEGDSSSETKLGETKETAMHAVKADTAKEKKM